MMEIFKIERCFNRSERHFSKKFSQRILVFVSTNFAFRCLLFSEIVRQFNVFVKRRTSFQKMSHDGPVLGQKLNSSAVDSNHDSAFEYNVMTTTPAVSHLTQTQSKSPSPSSSNSFSSLVTLLQIKRME